MNVLKHMEVIFLTAVVLAGVTSYASAAIPAPRQHVTVQNASAAQQVAVITVTAKRLSAAEKARL
ncbi:hypothetical protein HH212_10270 [Massilia forsythiae]|uniref:Uncharacterized protein n=1 Tax=Massilia forsythiae TaxID=2728020 RepID=A0A7Z2VWD6_9BURK|nr:hypothetical protein [Massilia forsythiae]QJE00359.1 hypothetical protein HH212_10270 [Massilia forsythiae]